MATPSDNLAWEIPTIEEPFGLQSMRSQRVGHDWATNTFTFTLIKASTIPEALTLKYYLVNYREFLNKITKYRCCVGFRSWRWIFQRFSSLSHLVWPLPISLLCSNGLNSHSCPMQETFFLLPPSSAVLLLQSFATLADEPSSWNIPPPTDASFKTQFKYQRLLWSLSWCPR